MKRAAASIMSGRCRGESSSPSEDGVVGADDADVNGRSTGRDRAQDGIGDLEDVRWDVGDLWEEERNPRLVLERVL